MADRRVVCKECFEKVVNFDALIKDDVRKCPKMCRCDRTQSTARIARAENFGYRMLPGHETLSMSNQTNTMPSQSTVRIGHLTTCCFDVCDIRGAEVVAFNTRNQLMHFTMNR